MVAEGSERCSALPDLHLSPVPPPSSPSPSSSMPQRCRRHTQRRWRGEQEKGAFQKAGYVKATFSCPPCRSLRHRAASCKGPLPRQPPAAPWGPTPWQLQSALNTHTCIKPPRRKRPPLATGLSPCRSHVHRAADAAARAVALAHELRHDLLDGAAAREVLAVVAVGVFVVEYCFLMQGSRLFVCVACVVCFQQTPPAFSSAAFGPRTAYSFCLAARRPLRTGPPTTPPHCHLDRSSGLCSLTGTT